MLSFLSQKLRFLLVFVLIIIGVSFIFFGSWTPSGGVRGSGVFGVVEGRKISQDEFAAAERATQVAHTFYTGRVLDLKSRHEAYLASHAWSRLVALEAARQAGISITDQQAVDAIRENPLFQEDGKYATEKLQQFFEYFLTPQGVTSERFQEIVREELAVRTFLEGLESSAVVMPAEIEEAMNRQWGAAKVSVVRFTLEEARRSLKPSDEELEAFYKEHAASYVTPERRKVEFVEFKLDEKTSGDKRAEALSKLGEKAFDFTDKFLNVESGAALPDFKKTATDAGLTLQASDWILQENSSLPQLQKPELARVVFELTAENPVTDYLPMPDGFVVFHLLEVQPSQPLPFQEIVTRVREDFVQQRAVQLTQEQASAFCEAARKKLAEGESWDKAVGALGRQAAGLPPFVPAEKNQLKAEDADTISVLAPRLAVGQVSSFEPTEKGGLVVYLESRTPPSAEKKKELAPKVEEYLLEMRREQIVEEWLDSRLNSPQTRLPAGFSEKFAQE
ncbi:MAG: peptidyl-prolyl cis-trans isomerase [bacterium]